MKIAIRYYTQTGNTKKLADAIAAELGVAARSIDSPLEEDVDVLFLCNSVYWAGVDGKVKKFLKSPGAKIGQLVNVSTAALIEATYGQMKKLAADAGIPLSEREFHCKGSFKMMHKGKPDDADITAVKRFAREIAG